MRRLYCLIICFALSICARPACGGEPTALLKQPADPVIDSLDIKKLKSLGKEPEHSLPVYRLSVAFDLKTNLLRGVASIELPEAVDMTISTGNLRIRSATMNGSPVEYKEHGLGRIAGKGILKIIYEGIFKGQEHRAELENAGIVSSGVVSERGISLTGNWYPEIEGLAYYELTAAVPNTFIAISEADKITSRTTVSGKEYSFLFPHPSTGIDLVAGNYREVRSSENGIDIYTYLFPEDISLAADYIEHTKKYLKMYDELLVPYPYKRFSVVENILPTGNSMPTFTLLGQEILRLPFIPETSLGHEITHQWFGNYVFADFKKGNWLEAITSYMSDHLYEEQKGRGWEDRKNILINFQSYVTPDKDFPLRQFTGRTGFASAVIGYGKGAMLFHMLEKMIGREAFIKSLRRLIEENKFRKASWADVEKPFELESGMDLGWFFSQWLDGKGIPSFEVMDPRALVLKGSPTVSFELAQRVKPYRIELPVSIVAEEGQTKQVLSLEKEKKYFEITAKNDPSDVVFDENYDVMRTLAPGEFPPVVARLLGDEKKLIVYPEKEKKKYANLIAIFGGEGFTAKEQSALNDDDIRTSSLLVLGFESPVLSRLFGTVRDEGKGFELIVRENPLNRSKVVAYAQGASKEEVDLAAQKIFHYGKYSVIRFEKGDNTAKSTAGTARGMVFNLREPVEGVEPARSLKLVEIIDSISDKPIILIGERHTYYEDHKVELSVIMGLFQKGRKFAIGMEMFQKPFQQVIDKYLSGAIDERAFIEKTEYFKRWGFDYNLYREILEFARAKGIPVIALNQRSEIVDKVARGGLDALSPEEKKEIPQDMDMSDDSYRKRLKEVYKDHPAGTTFENFYQSQILWDETMAHSAAQFLKKRPDYQMVVLAGSEHIMYGSGIPHRVFRLTDRDYVTLINGSFDKDIGDYVLFPKHLKPPFTAKLGITARESHNMVSIDDLSPDGAALKAGLENGDIITSVAGREIHAVSDIKIALFDKKPGQTVSVKVARKIFLFITRGIELYVTL